MDFQNVSNLFYDQASSLEDDHIPNSGNSAELSPVVTDSGSQTSIKNYDSGELDQISYLNKSPDCNIPLPKLEPSENHSVLFCPHIESGAAPQPHPLSFEDKWDSDHVRMPCSPQNKYSVENGIEGKKMESRWELICQSLKKNIKSSKELEAAIMSYNSEYVGKWSFEGLHAFINKHLDKEERNEFFEITLPAMIKTAIDLPNICTQPIPLLKKGKDHYITISQKQIGCLLLNAFFCTFPGRYFSDIGTKERLTYEYGTYPDINCNQLFAGVENSILPEVAAKLKCLFHYFRRITSEEPSGTVTFHRQSILAEDLPKWHESTHTIRTAVIKADGLIESDGHGMLQVDFADEYVGCQVLGLYCDQEQIRFIISPELIAACLFVESMDCNEAVIIMGAERYSEYSGYRSTFRWQGDFRDKTPRDSWGRRYTQLVAIDATFFENPIDQFKPQFIKRELNKAYCGFYENGLPSNLPAIATGNWGCGVFKGNRNLKFLIQLMAVSEAGRSLLYFTRGKKELERDLQKMYNFLTDKNLVVGDIWRLLLTCSENVNSFSEKEFSNFYDFIYSQFSTKEGN